MVDNGIIITVLIAVVYTGFYFKNYYDLSKVGKWQEMELANEISRAKAAVDAYKKEHNIASMPIP